MTRIDRREFVGRLGSAAGAVLLTPSLAALASYAAGARDLGAATTLGYGPLMPNRSVPELVAPRGFTLQRLSRTRRQSLGDRRFRVPQAFDGMGAFPLPNGNVRLIRNHEIRDAAATAIPLGHPSRSYDRRAGGGTTSLELERHADGSYGVVAEYPSLSGTHVNCAGGVTPWGSWISCEETTEGPSQGRERAHGYCFEVSADATLEVEPVPLRAMGRFVHEAVAVDPRTRIVYLTEDMALDHERMERLPGSGFYRFLPRTSGRLVDGGRLEALAVVDRPRYDSSRGQLIGATFTTRWVTIDDPDPSAAELDPSAVFRQGLAKGAARFQRLEGCWWGEGAVFFNATAGGDALAGQVWRYRPTSDDGGELTLILESPGRDVLDRPDNICVSPRGGLVLCEDGEDTQFLRGVTREGALFDLVRTVGPSSEMCGACFSPDGSTLFFNTQGSTSRLGTEVGATYALWGEWERGAL